MLKIQSAPSEFKEYNLIEYEFHQEIGEIGHFALHFAPLTIREKRSFFADVKSLNQVYGKVIELDYEHWIYKGLITKVDNIDANDHVIVVVSDKTWNLAHRIRSQTFYNQNLQNMGSKMVDGCCPVKFLNNCEKGKNRFFIQFNELDFLALKRLADYSAVQWWYDGQALCMGHDNGRIKEMQIDKDIYDCKLACSLGNNELSVRTHLLSNHSVQANNIDISRESGEIQASLKNASKDGQFKSLLDFVREDNSFGDGKWVGESFSRRILSDQMIFRAKTDNLLVIGDKIAVEDTKGNKETFIVESVHGHAPEGGRCKFSIYATNMVSALTYDQQKTQYSIAKVVATHDDMNRVKITFDWDANHTQSPWLRMLSIHWGKEHSIFIPPKIDDFVLVMWGPEAMEPVVLGAISVGTHAKNPESGITLDAGNGRRIRLNDDSIELTHSSSSIKLTSDSIELNSESIKLTAPKLKIDASDNIGMATQTLEFETTESKLTATTLKLDASQISA